MIQAGRQAEIQLDSMVEEFRTLIEKESKKDFLTSISLSLLQQIADLEAFPVKNQNRRRRIEEKGN